MEVADVAVALLFTFHQLTWNETADLWIHGYGDNDFAAYAIVPTLDTNEPPGAVEVIAQLTYGTTARDGNDGSVGRNISVQNQSVGPQPFISVDVLEFKESY
jgi:hypothetical protein